MTDDLVKRLRYWYEYDEDKINDDCKEAADRIEQLEAALRETIMCWNYEQCAELARAALGEKKDVAED